MMDIRPIDENFSVSPQIEPADLHDLTGDGYQVLICNRPDGEEPGQPEASAMREAATDAGMSFHYIPISGGVFPEDSVSAFGEVRRREGRKTIAYCRTGTRSITLETLANPAGRSPDERLQLARRAGYDLSSLAAQLDE